MSEEPGSGDEKRLRLFEALLAEESRRGAVLGGLGAALAGVGLWVGLALAIPVARDEFDAVALMTIFMGVLVGFGVRNWGRGLRRGFALWGAALTFLAQVAGSALAAAAKAAERSRMDFWPFLRAYLNPRWTFELVTEALDGGGFLLFVLGLLLAWRQSRRRLSPDHLARLLGRQA